MTADRTSRPVGAEEPTSLPERSFYVALLAGAPVIWLVQFLLSYITAAVACGAVAGSSPSPAGARAAIVAYTIAALVGIALVGIHGYRRHRHGSETLPHDMDTPGDRHRFLGFATLLLAGLSAVATLYVGMTSIFFTTCR